MVQPAWYRPKILWIYQLRSTWNNLRGTHQWLCLELNLLLLLHGKLLLLLKLELHLLLSDQLEFFLFILRRVVRDQLFD